jgi:hypothetical protein
MHKINKSIDLILVTGLKQIFLNLTVETVSSPQNIINPGNGTELTQKIKASPPLLLK